MCSDRVKPASNCFSRIALTFPRLGGFGGQSLSRLSSCFGAGCLGRVHGFWLKLADSAFLSYLVLGGQRA
jgi:hypothetical protein